MSTNPETKETEKPFSPVKAFFFGFFLPVTWALLSYLIFPGDSFLWAYPGGLALAAIVGLYTGFREKRWSFLLGLSTSLGLIMAYGLVISWLRS